MDLMMKNLGWTDVCCLCGQNVVSYHNPDPLRSGEKNCCDACNRLVIAARRRLAALEAEERTAYLQQLHKASYEQIKTMLEDNPMERE